MTGQSLEISSEDIALRRKLQIEPRRQTGRTTCQLRAVLNYLRTFDGDVLYITDTMFHAKHCVTMFKALAADTIQFLPRIVWTSVDCALVDTHGRRFGFVEFDHVAIEFQFDKSKEIESWLPNVMR